MSSLTRDEAVQRAALLKVREYRIDIDVSMAADADEFTSTTVITFDCARPGEATFVELRPTRLHEVVLNGAALDVATLTENRLALPDLRATNELVVRATFAYSNTGEGLHRFVDPEDKNVYLYAQTFLDDAQRIYACFDQPDLKARFSVAVTAPEGWLVAANGAGDPVAPGRWRFATTEPLSTYLTSFIAGPYHVRRHRHDGIELGLYCRQGLAAHLDKDADEIFEVTAQGFDRFHQMFGIRYPFGKYDQAFVPEFNAGAMENAGLVTIRDEFIYRSAVPDSERQLRAVVIIHELAHMWFGDLVTMRWWDDLWLNESFAEYMGYRVVDEATRFDSAWVDFAVGRKGWGYNADQRPSTHPVAPESVADTAAALLNFDGISYAKGASVLRQLAVWLGDDVFLAGVRAHFEANAFGNAALADFLAALERVSGRDVAGWAELWLRRAQVNTLRPVVEFDQDGRYASVRVRQTAPADYPTLRPHRLAIGVYAGGERRELVEVDLDPAADGGDTAVPGLVGVAHGDLLLLNDRDYTYAKVRFDPASAAALPRVLGGISDGLARALVWSSVLDAVRDAEVPTLDLVELCAAALPSETELTVVRDVTALAVGSVDAFLPPPQRPAARATLGRACLAAVERAEPGSGRQLAATLGFLRTAGESDVDRLWGWLRGDSVPDGLAVDAELRWTILGRLAVVGAASEADIDAEFDRDRSAFGAERAARCRASRPDPAAKAEAWRIIVDDDVLSNRLVEAAAAGFWQPDQGALTESYVERFFTEMPAMAARRTPNVVFQVAFFGFPQYAVAESTVEMAEAMLARDDLSPMLRRVAVDATDQLRRALAARRLSEAGRRAGP